MKRSRYRRIVFFFARVILGLIFWELLLPRIGFRGVSNRNRSERLRRIAQAFHTLAVHMGGVMIKIGQFLSARMDMLPDEITSELAGLQDEVPPVDFNEIRELAEKELNGTLSEKFAHFEEIPLAAASLGQVHRAKLIANPSGEDAESFGVNVVVKVQRPDIETIIATDLTALQTVTKWVIRYKPIRRRADVPALLAEFSRILYEEIDYLAEGGNADTFAQNFVDNPGVRIPAVVWPLTTRRVLTLEDVYAIKVTDYDEINQAGIDRSEVAKRLFDIYLKQIFEDGFFHADPHPGNLFVDPGTPGEDGERQWLLTFVDFGMVGHIPANARAGLRELAIGIGTKDAGRLVKAYQLMNVLLPGADLELIGQAETMAFDRFWGKSMEELRDISFEEMHDFAREFRELIFEMPFQVPQDLVFLARTVAILAGICTGLDPGFNFWESLAPYAQQLVSEEGGTNWQFWLAEIGAVAQSLIALPRKFESLADKMHRGNLAIRTPDLERQIKRLDASLRRVALAVVFLAFLTGGVQLYLGGEEIFANVLFRGAGLALIAFMLARPRRRM